MGRLGVGEFEIQLEGRVTPSTIDARNIFFRCVREFAPEVLISLKEEPFKLFLKTKLYYESDKRRKTSPAKRFKWTKNIRPSWGEIEVNNPFLQKENLLINKDKNIKRFAESVFDWSKTYNLNHFWCREIVYETMDLWCSSEIACEETEWRFEIPFAPDTGIGFKFNYEISLSYPIYGYRNEVREEEISLFKKWLDNVLNECELNAQQDELIKTTLHRNEFDHFEWLAMYQCKPMSLERIAEKVNRERKTVENGIKKAAEICKLKLRNPLPPGRKRKK